MYCIVFLCYITALSCVDDDIRLVDGFSSEEGTLEVCENGGWNAVCGDGFGSQDAYVACRQLGLGASSELNISTVKIL